MEGEEGAAGAGKLDNSSQLAPEPSACRKQRASSRCMQEPGCRTRAHKREGDGDK